MQKKTIEIPKFETAQTGIDVKEVWITSDGVEHDNESSAEWHEFRWRTELRNKQFNLPMEERVCTLDSKEDLERVIAYTADYNHEEPDLSQMTYPCTVVIFRDDVHCDCDWDSQCDGRITRIVSISEFKQIIIDRLTNVDSE